VYASKTRREKFSGHDENCQTNASDLEDSLITSSRPPGRPQRRPEDRTSNDGVAAQAADGSQRTADAADEQCPRCGCSSLSCTVVPCAADIGEPTYCTHSGTSSQCSSSCSIGESAIVLPRVANDAGSGIHNSLEQLSVVDLDAPARMALQYIYSNPRVTTNVGHVLVERQG